MRYRSHIDGLRAFAIVPVVLFHLGSDITPGGYIGVDIFFVISGFLITSILYRDMINNQYSLMEFYKRRILRILPALTTVLISAAIAGFFILLPNERVDLGKSIVATAGFFSNFYFWQDSGYFTGPAESNPLLHTWSLAVEEQFYILFPPFLYLIVRHARKHALSLLVVLSIISFFCCLFATKIDQPTAFYLLPFRAWEMGIGSILAIYLMNREDRNNDSFILSLIGLILICVPFFTLNSESNFPGWNALYPCLGTMMLIGFAEGNIVGRFLSFTPFVFIGKISYSLYLWHWPLIVFWKIYTGEEIDHWDMVGLGVISIILATFSTYIIEKPFRNRRFRAIPSSRTVLIGASTLTIIFSVGVLFTSNILSKLNHYPNAVVKIASAAEYREWPDYSRQFRTGQCLIGQASRGVESFDKKTCTNFDESRTNVLVIGDSHAAQYWGAFHEIFKGANVMQATASGCRFLVDSDGAKRCTDLRDWVFEEFLPNTKVDAVVLGGRWHMEELSKVAPTLELLTSMVPSIILIGPTVEYKGSLPLLLARSTWKNEPFDFDSKLVPGKIALDNSMKEIAAQSNVPYISPLTFECLDNSCRLFGSDGNPMQFDYGHLTLSGAIDIVSTNLELIENAIKYRL